MSSMYNFQTYGQVKTIPCPNCDGEGKYYAEVPVVDFTNGGYLDERLVECEDCDGSGELDDD